MNYQIEELIGQGRQSCVYRALRTDKAGIFSQRVALKILNSKTQVEFWRAEFESLAQVRSIYCVQVLGFDWFDERPGLILEYVDGVTLAELLRSQALTAGEIQWLIKEIRLGLESLHQQGLVHGDLSLNNVMIDLKGQIKLLDFGFGNHLGSVRRLTKEFASPDLLLGESPTPQTDFYSLERIAMSLRHFQISEDEFSKEGLLEKLDCAYNHCRSLGGATVEVQLSLRKPRKFHWIWSVCAFSVLAVSASAQKQRSDQPPAQLRIRSNYGYEFFIDGRPLGAAPKDLVGLNPGTYSLKWRLNQRHGERVLTLKPGDNILLNDSEFR